MRFATLIHEHVLRERVAAALTSMGIEVLSFARVDVLMAALIAQRVAAVVVEDDKDRIDHWLRTLRTNLEEQITLIAIGAGGAAGMSKALLLGADDYVVVGVAADQFVNRALARIGAKLQRPHRDMWRLGPYTLDATRSCLVSTSAVVHLSPRESLLARVLFENQGRVVALERLCEDLCARVDVAARRAVKQHAHMLRKKCERAAGEGDPRLHLQAVYGKGYRLSL